MRTQSRTFLAVRKKPLRAELRTPWLLRLLLGVLHHIRKKKQKRGTRKYKDMCQIFTISLPPHSVRDTLLPGLVLLFPAVTAASPGVVWKQWSRGGFKAVIYDWLCFKWHQIQKKITWVKRENVFKPTPWYSGTLWGALQASYWRGTRDGDEDRRASPAYRIHLLMGERALGVHEKERVSGEAMPT